MLFDKTNLCGIETKNRFIRAATWMGMAIADGKISSELIESMTSLGKGNTGLIITGHACVSPEGIGGPRQIAIYDDSFIPGLSRLVKAVHETDTPIVLQLSHAGNFAADKLIKETPLAVSLYDGLSKKPRREMTVEDIQRLVQDFTSAAERAKKAGFDGIEIHMAHGYLLSQFLSPVFNHRTDEYGGTLKGRAKAPLEIISAIRKKVGTDYPIFVKLNGEDFVEGGLTAEEALEIGRLLVSCGTSAIEISGGLLSTPATGPCRRGITTPEEEGYFRKHSKKFKEELPVPIILTGGIRRLITAEEIISKGEADYIALSRPLICEPDLISKWSERKTDRARCISCNKCFLSGLKGRRVSCVIN